MSSEKYLSLAEACMRLGVSESTVRRYIGKGLLDATQAGNRTFVMEVSLDRLLRARSDQIGMYANSRTGLTRRTLLATAGKYVPAAIAGVLSGTISSGTNFFVWDHFRDLESKGVPSIEELFPFWKDIQLLPGKVHPVDGFSPDVKDAQEKIVPLMYKSAPVECLSLEKLPEAALHGDLLLIGGPITNPVSCELHGHRFKGQKISVSPTTGVGTRWSFYYPYPTTEDKAFRRYVGGKSRSTWPKAIIDHAARAEAAVALYSKINPETEQILSDYLLITVMPNHLRPDSTGATIIDVADLHGQGDKAFADILEDPELRRELKDARKGKRYFEALYEVPVTHDDERRLSMPGRPHLIDIFALG